MGSDSQTDDAGVLCGAYGQRTLELVGFDLENEGRLTHPMVYDQATDRYLEISWEALAKIGAALRALPYPDMAEFYTSGRASNEAAFPLSAACVGIRNQQLSSNSIGS